jgi:hypothetical protein
MGKFDPGAVKDGRAPAASHYRPLIGLYDSSDPDVLEYQTLEMKVAGIDGVLIDWYGTENLYDYATNHRNTLRMIEAVKKAGLKFAIVYEDQTVNNLVAKGIWTKENAVAKGQELMKWVDANWFRSPSYVHVGGRPVFLVFGPQYFKEGEWTSLFSGLASKPIYLSVHFKRATSDGAYDWPLPGGGTSGSDKHIDDYYEAAKQWPYSFPVAFPRFHDFYADAGLHASYGQVEDRDGKTYEGLLRRAFLSRPPVIQLSTWNDWGEGTQIEPSVEFGYRDLEVTQRLRGEFSGNTAYSAADLRLPMEVYGLRKRFAGDAVVRKRIDGAVSMLFRGNPRGARKVLAALPKP